MDTTRHDSFCPICFCPIWRQPSFFVSSPVGVEGHWTVHSLVWMAHALPRCSRLPAASEPTTLCIYRVQRQAREGAMPRLLAGHRSLSVSASLCFASGNLAVPIWPRLATANLHLLTLGSLSTISHASPSIPAPPPRQTNKEMAKSSKSSSEGSSTARPSSDSDEKFGLLNDEPVQQASRPSRLRWAVALLAASNLVCFGGLVYALRPAPPPTMVVYPPQPDWFPPQSEFFVLRALCFFFLL